MRLKPKSTYSPFILVGLVLRDLQKLHFLPKLDGFLAEIAGWKLPLHRREL
jgi:hypothetical protein